MYAVVEIAGKQFKVSKDEKITVHRLPLKEGDSVDFDKILLIDNDGAIQVGTPVLESAKVSAEIVKHFRGDKVKVFKKKRRKGYRKLNGHRQDLTQVKITGIVG